jgi:spermidine synthase
MSNYYSKILEYSGLLAELNYSSSPPAQWVLTIDGALHSSVNYDDPSQLYFSYTKRVSNTIETLFFNSKKISTLHLGAGALSFARYIEATKPGSYQVAVEIEPNLYEFVESVLPLKNKDNIELLVGDAEEVVKNRIEEFAGKFDLIIVEIFLGSEETTDVTTLDFFKLLKKTLKADGAVVVNVIDVSPYKSALLRGQFIKHTFGECKFIVDIEEIKSNSSSNLVLVGASVERLSTLPGYTTIPIDGVN